MRPGTDVLALYTSHALFFFFFFFSERAARAEGGGMGRCETFSFSFFPCSADHERDWPPCKVVFFGLATNALNVRNNNNNNNFHIGNGQCYSKLIFSFSLRVGCKRAKNL